MGLQRDGQLYAEKLQRDAATMSATEKKELEEKILTVREQLSQKVQPPQQNIQRRQNEERNKILALIKRSIQLLQTTTTIWFWMHRLWFMQTKATTCHKK